MKTAYLVAALALISGPALAEPLATCVNCGSSGALALNAEPSVYLVIEEIRRTLPGDGYVPPAPLGPMAIEQCEKLRRSYEGWPGTASVACRPAIGWRTCMPGPGFGMACPVFDPIIDVGGGSNVR